MQFGRCLALAAVAIFAVSAAPPSPDAMVPAFANPPPKGTPFQYPAEMTQAQSDYVEHCGGCHGIHGYAAPADLPTIGGRVGWFMCLPEGRKYLVRLPNIARSRITDNEQLADLLNFMVFGLGGGTAPAGAKPFTADEVARERASPFTSVSLIQTRKLIVEKLIKGCGAPASLRLMYPGEVKPTKTTTRSGFGTKAD
ncbi:c-type cytochrome [Sandarakinorhabdus sp.]|uniref:c-type cytochrome n=1 Tax=Sandarakinorhabdus sp. TaxID=1916663 RepID=UPI003F722584